MREHPYRDRRLPTRVSAACDRCRRRKQRCDDQRPCSNCTSVDLACTSTSVPAARRPRHVNRTSTNAPVSGFDTQTSGGHRSPLDTNLSHGNPIRGDSSHTQRDGDGRAEPTEGLGHSGSHVQIMHTSPASITSSDTRTHRTLARPDFDEGGSAISITKKIFDEANSNSYRDRETFAIPGSDVLGNRVGSQEHQSRMTISEVLDGVNFPPTPICDVLLESYFHNVHWFSLVVFEPRFRARYTAITEAGGVNTSDRGFLLLLSMILIMGSWYGSQDQLFDLRNVPYDVMTMRRKLLTPIRSHFMDMMDEDSLEFVQLSTLLGSMYLYHSRPRASFSILGAATRTAQAMRLHLESHESCSFEDKEERKRVWWTIYTWDRFATIIYGRPLGVNDRDCNVSMPSLFEENITFDPTLGPSLVCLSAYQVQLNTVYHIASPVLDNLYTIQHSQDTSQQTKLSILIAKVDQELKQWRDKLPPFLDFNVIRDIGPNSTAEEKSHSLQAFSLQLTYDNLIMVINRPLLTDKISLPSPTLQSPLHDRAQSAEERIAETQHNTNRRKLALRRCLNSALSISKVQSKRNLVQLAQQTHLLSFIGINLFTASVVLYVCARSDILSNLAQDAKRGMSRILHMQKLFSSHVPLSLQCSVILEDLVRLVVEKEKEALLSNEFNDELTADSNIEDQTNTVIQNSMERNEVPPGGDLSYVWPAEMADMSDHNNYFRESLISLQRVVQENAMDYQGVSDQGTSFVPPSNIPAMENWRYADPSSYGNDIGQGGGRLEDLGQLWLWDL